MIVSWMSYAFLVGALVTIAALAVERVFLARGWPARLVWAGALFLSVAVPVADAIRQLLPSHAQQIGPLPFAITVQPMSSAAMTADAGASIGRWALIAWAMLSALCIARLLYGIVALRRARRRWSPAEVDGTTVQISDNVGPAVVGLRPMDVVVPEWILSMDASLRAIVLRHEEEHRAARDPYLLCAAAIAVALVPWSVPLWIQARRLRLAIELDCDARVLDAHPSPERYGLLMMTIAQRRATAPTLFAPMLSEPATQLERRILAMKHSTKRLGRLAMIGASAVALGVLGFACALQSDNPTAPTPTPASASASKTPLKPYMKFTLAKQATPLASSASPRYPDMLRSAGVEGEVVAEFVVDTSGRAIPSTFKVIRSNHDLFTSAVKLALPNMRFAPAEVAGGRKVKQLIEMPFEFDLAHGATTGAGHMPIPAGPARQYLKPVSAQVSAERAGKTALPAGVYYEYQVEQPVRPVSGNVAPRYPDMLRSAGVEGEVLAQFIVDEQGRVDSSTVRVLKSSHDLFTNAVLGQIGKLRFTPALVGGRPVKQLVQMPFQFNLSK